MRVRTGERLKALREESDLSQEKIAREVDVSRGTIQNWEAGATGMGAEDMEVLSGIFGVSLDYLAGVTDDPRPASELADLLDAAEEALEVRAVEDAPNDEPAGDMPRGAGQ